MNQSGRILFKVLFIKEFAILLSQVKVVYDFWDGLEVNQFLS